jgi:hypothetical protein
MTSLSDNQQCYARGSYGSHTTSRVFLHLSIVLLCLRLRLVVLRLSIFSLPFVLWVGATLSLLLL